MLPPLTSLCLTAVETEAQNREGCWASRFTVQLSPAPCFFCCLRPLPSISGMMGVECGAHIHAPPSQVPLGISVGTQSRKEPELGRIQEVNLEEEKGNKQSPGGCWRWAPWFTKHLLFFPAGDGQALSHWTAKETEAWNKRLIQSATERLIPHPLRDTGSWAG